tara:strand:+ start:674 stop:1012 length:339 start_codon:yes stop_codon:yes gene_type:complete
MFSKQTLAKIFFCLTIVIAILPKFVRAEDDDEDILGEIMVDLFIGVAMAACETSATCSSFMTIVTIAIVLFTTLGCCINGCKCDDEYTPNRKIFRRVGTAGVGYGIGRNLFH